MDTQLKNFRTFKGTLANTTITFWEMLFENDGLEFNAWYQRDYVWGHKEQQDFLATLISGFPVGVIATVQDINKEFKWVELVDGKQRITTLKLFMENVIPFGDIWYEDISVVDKRFFRNLSLPYYDLSNGTEKDKLDFFYRINFTGVPQSDEHRKMIVDKIKDL